MAERAGRPALKVRYVVTILLEFLRSVLENQIPLQPAQQTMLIKFVIQAKQYATLHQILQFYVLTDSLELARVLVSLGSKGVTQQAYYEPAFQLGLDMLQRLRENQEIVVALINEDQVMKALDFALEHNVHSIKMSSLLENVEQARLNGDDEKVSMIMARLKDPNIRGLLVDE